MPNKKENEKLLAKLCEQKRSKVVAAMCSCCEEGLIPYSGPRGVAAEDLSNESLAYLFFALTSDKKSKSGKRAKELAFLQNPEGRFLIDYIVPVFNGTAEIPSSMIAGVNCDFAELNYGCSDDPSSCRSILFGSRPGSGFVVTATFESTVFKKIRSFNRFVNNSKK